MNIEHTEYPCDSLDDVGAVASFLAFVLDQAAFHKFSGSMGEQDCKGMATIVAWMANQIGICTDAARDKMQETALDGMKQLGIPLEALADERLRSVWRAGFSQGVAHCGKGV